MTSPAPHKRKRQHEVAVDITEQGDVVQQDDVEVTAFIDGALEAALGSPAAKKARAEAPTELDTAGAPQGGCTNPTVCQADMGAPTGHPEQPQEPFTGSGHDVDQSPVPKTSAPASAPTSAPASAPTSAPAPAPRSGAPTASTTTAGPLEQLLHHLAAAAQLLVASTQSMHASSLTADQHSGLRELNGQLTQLVGQLDEQVGPGRAKQGSVCAGQQAKLGTVQQPGYAARSTMTPRMVLLTALDQQISRGGPAAAGTGTSMKAGSFPGLSTAIHATAAAASAMKNLPKQQQQHAHSKPWPAEFELTMASAKLRNVPVSQLNSKGIAMFAASCSSRAEGGVVPGVYTGGGPGAGTSLALWKAWVQSSAGPATTGDTHVPFAMLNTNAQLRMLKGFWELKQRKAPQGQAADAAMH